MCTICQALNPETPVYDFHDLVAYGTVGGVGVGAEISRSNGQSVDVGSGGNAGSLPVYSLDQIANQLTDGYWDSRGQSSRQFDTSDSNVLTVDISGLTVEGQNLALAALEAWSDVIDIEFELYQPPSISVTRYEVGDAVANTSTNASMNVNEQFEGTLSGSGDRDWISIDLVAGQTYTVSLNGDGSSNELNDPYLRLLNSSGSLVAQNDDSNGLDSQLVFTASVSGRYYVSAGSYADNGSGDYVVTVASGTQSSPDIVFDDEDSGAYASSSVSGGFTQSAFINISTAWLASSGTSINSYSYQTYLHEIGHALGLGHAGNYNGNASYGNDALYANDSWQATMMSYFSETENSFVQANFGYVLTPQMADILAGQNLYGASTRTSGDSVYGVGATTDTNFNLTTSQAQTIYDNGGIDLINISSSNANQRLDLNAETFSDLFGRTGNLGIARDTVIENATLGNGSDHVIGNDANNVIQTNGGDDTVYGRGGADTIFGGSGDDTIMGGVGSDRLVGNADDDNLLGGLGNDRLEGGVGRDTLFGEDGDDTLFGGWGDDTLVGGNGSDVLYGEDGNDSLNGGAQNDVLVGGSGNDTLVGGSGQDTLRGEDGGDQLFGGDDNDTLSGGAGSDRLYGEAGNDTLIGGDQVDYIFGGNGNDRLEGGAAGDVLRGESGMDALFAGSGNDFLFGGANDDLLFGEDGNDRIDGGTGNDTMVGGGGNDVFIFEASFGSDRISDFVVGQDAIDLSALIDITSFADLTNAHLSQESNGTTITSSNGEIYLVGVTASTLTEAEFIF